MKQLTMIVTAYNVEQYIGKTLDSLLQQTYQDFTILVIDDGSNDGTLQIIQDYHQKHSQIEYYTKPNAGIAHTRNFALEKVKTPYFGFLDGDDTCSSDMLEKMMDKIITEQSDIVVCNFDWVYEDKKSETEVEGPYFPGKEMVVHLFATLWNKIYNTEFIKSTNVSFPDGYRYEDACFLYCIAPYVKKLSFVQVSFIQYYQRSGSITHTNNHHVKDMIDVFKIIQDAYKRKGLYETYFQELEYIHIRFFLGNSFLRSAQIKDKKIRNETIMLGWDLLNETFPCWHKNKYLKTLPGLKNKYYRTVRKYNIRLYAWIFHMLKK